MHVMTYFVLVAACGFLVRFVSFSVVVSVAEFRRLVPFLVVAAAALRFGGMNEVKRKRRERFPDLPKKLKKIKKMRSLKNVS